MEKQPTDQTSEATGKGVRDINFEDLWLIAAQQDITGFQARLEVLRRCREYNEKHDIPAQPQHSECSKCNGRGGEPMYSGVPFEADDWRICAECNGTGTANTIKASGDTEYDRGWLYGSAHQIQFHKLGAASSEPIRTEEQAMEDAKGQVCFARSSECSKCEGRGGEPMYSGVPFEADDWRICSECNGTGKASSEPQRSELGVAADAQAENMREFHNVASSEPKEWEKIIKDLLYRRQIPDKRAGELVKAIDASIAAADKRYTKAWNEGVMWERERVRKQISAAE